MNWNSVVRIWALLTLIWNQIESVRWREHLQFWSIEVDMSNNDDHEEEDDASQGGLIFRKVLMAY